MTVVSSNRSLVVPAELFGRQFLSLAFWCSESETVTKLPTSRNQLAGIELRTSRLFSLV